MGEAQTEPGRALEMMRPSYSTRSKTSKEEKSAQSKNRAIRMYLKAKAASCLSAFQHRKMYLLRLPTELLLLLATFLEKERDLNSLSRTSRRLYALLNTYLYRRNAQNSKGSALLWAARYGNEATARMSIQEGALTQAVKAMDCTGRTPLSWAAENGHVAVVKLLLETGRVGVNQEEISWDEGLYIIYQGEDFTGEMVDFDENGVMIELVNYYGGLAHGWQYEWFPDGLKKMQGRCNRGSAVGEWHEWFPNGQLARHDVFTDSGQLLKRERWTETGELVVD
ncbi:hypothetical protein FQN54_004342 [Arachnomyces sp. PD_36]|nr:hypothetical protein FQN54_004342 [Arachnomyces sp. PD_36]